MAGSLLMSEDGLREMWWTLFVSLYCYFLFVILLQGVSWLDIVPNFSHSSFLQSQLEFFFVGISQSCCSDRGCHLNRNTIRIQ